MPAFFEFLRNITYYLVFMAVVGVIGPSGTYKKYIALVMGIMLVGMMLDPISMIVSRDIVPMTEIFGNVLPAPLSGISPGVFPDEDGNFGWQEDHLREIFHNQLTNQLSSLIARSKAGAELISAEWETSEDFTYIQRLFIRVRVTDDGFGPNNGSNRVPFIRVEPVRIAPYQPQEPDDLEEPEEPEISQEIKKIISDFYDMSMDNIHVEILKE